MENSTDNNRPIEDALRARIAVLEAELLKSHTALNMVLNPRTPSDIILAVKYLEGLK